MDLLNMMLDMTEAAKEFESLYPDLEVTNEEATKVGQAIGLQMSVVKNLDIKSAMLDELKRVKGVE